MTTPPMFTPYAMRGVTVPNRLAVSPMCMYSADDGTPTDFHLVHLGGFAMGGTGLVMTEMTDVSADGRITPGCAGLYTAEHVKAWRRVADFIHGNTPAKFGIQVSHAGRKGSTHRPWDGGSNKPLEPGGWETIAPSSLPLLPESPPPRAMTEDDIARVRADFVRTARLADEAGFDVIELHFAHGYLVAQFISPLTNQRNDGYGGPVENRARLAVEILTDVRKVWPADKPIMARISSVDFIDGGTTVEDAVVIARMLKDAGLDLLDVSSGGTTAAPRPRIPGLFNAPAARRIRAETGLPTALVGNFASPHEMNDAVASGVAEICMLGRGHLYDPAYARHAARALGQPLPWPKQYVLGDSFASPWALAAPAAQ
ncbi:MAG: hypothetical protein AB7K86_16325 [Rhodospirillales bacterium]